MRTALNTTLATLSRQAIGRALVACLLTMALNQALAQESSSDELDLDSLFDTGQDQPEAKVTPSSTPVPASPTVIALPERALPPQSRRRPPAVLEEIIVTAQKRAQDIQSVPLSVTAIGGADIVDKNMGDMNEVANYVPNLDILAVPTFPSIYMRGLGSSYNRGFEQSVAILIDEVFYGRASYINQGLLDLAAIEVLRGPQGTLFGKNSSAGAIHFRTAQPEHSFGGKVDVLLGELNLQRYRLIATGPLTDTLSGRIALLHETRDGGVLNTTTGIDEENRDNQGGRLRLAWDASSELRLDLTLNASVVNQHGAGSQLIRARQRHLAAMQVFDPQTNADPYDQRSAQDFAAGVSRDAWDGTLRADWTLDSGTTLTSISNLATLDEQVSFDADFSPVPFLILNNNEDLSQFSQEFRITSTPISSPGDLEFVAGLYFLRNDLDTTYDITDFLDLTEILLITGEGERRACVNLPNPQACQDAALDNAVAGRLAGEAIRARFAAQGGATPVESSLTRFGQLADSAALFGQFSWQIKPRWSATFGGRLNYEQKELAVDHRLVNHRTGQQGNAVLGGGLPGLGYGPGPNPGGAIIFPVIIAGETQFSAQRSRHDFNFIPKISSQYDIGDAAMAFGSIARGYKSGGYNAQPVNDQQLEFDEEDALTYELGFKSEWLGGAARFNLSVFRTEFDGLQVATFNGVSYVVGNAASATIQGVEYEAQMLLPYSLLLGLNGAFTDAKYDEFISAPCAAEETSAPPCNLSGQRLRLAPKLKTTLTAGWQHSLAQWPLIASAGITASYTDDVALATDLDPIDIRRAGTTFGLQLGIKSSNENWRVTLFGDNIGNHQSLAGAQDTPGFRGTHFGGAYPQASYELEIGLSF